MGQSYVKAPGAVLPYVFDFSGLVIDGDTLLSATVDAEDGLTVDDFNVIGAGTQVQVLLSGGTAYERYAVLCHCITTGAAEDERTMYLYVQAR